MYNLKTGSSMVYRDANCIIHRKKTPEVHCEPFELEKRERTCTDTALCMLRNASLSTFRWGHPVDTGFYRDSGWVLTGFIPHGSSPQWTSGVFLVRMIQSTAQYTIDVFNLYMWAWERRAHMPRHSIVHAQKCIRRSPPAGDVIQYTLSPNAILDEY